MHNKLAHLVIVGGGTAGWMAANLFAHKWATKRIRISLIESTELGTVGVGEGSTPFLRDFFDTLGISEADWMPACHATYKCGIRFPDWSTKKGYTSYFHPFYSDLDGPKAQQFFSFCRKKHLGKDAHAHPNDFFLASALTDLCRCPVSDTIPRQALSYAYHFDAALLGQFLKQHAIRLGVQHIDDKVIKVHRHANGDLALLETHKSGPVRADFFVDCSGFQGLLIQKTLGEKLISYKKYLCNDSAVAIQSNIDMQQPLAPETVSRAMQCGWIWHIPLYNRFGNGYVYCSDYNTADQAERELRAVLKDVSRKHNTLHLKWQPGRIQQHWKRNCLAIGLSQGFLEPLEAPMLFIVQKSIERFIELFTNADLTASLRDKYNAEINRTIDGTRDYLQAHYLLNSRSDTDYWIDNRNNPHVSPVLKKILQAWSTSGHIDVVLHEHQNELAYLKTSWYCLLAGKGCFSTQASTSTTAKQFGLRARQECELQAGEFAEHRQALQNMYSTANERTR